MRFSSNLLVREHVQPSCLLVAVRRVAGSPNLVLSVVGAQVTPKCFALKAYLHGVGGRTLLTTYKRHSALFPVLHEPGVDPLRGATLLLAEVPAKALAVAGVLELGNSRPSI